MKSLAFLPAFCFLLLVVGCQDKSPVSPVPTEEYGQLELSLNRSTVPQDVWVITLTLSRSGYQTIVRDFSVHETSVTARIDSLKIKMAC